MFDERSLLESLNKYYEENKKIDELSLTTACGAGMSGCYAAFNAIANNFPICLDKLIKAAVFEDRTTTLSIPGKRDSVEPIIQYYVGLMAASYRNYITILGRSYS